MKNLLGNEFDALVQSLDSPSPVSLRLNLNKPITRFEEDEKVEWCRAGRYLKERPSFTFDPLFQAGAYYVQEASSMFIEELWKQINPGNQPVKILDMCAAPGGKSTHLLSLMSKDSLLVSNEIITNRNKVLQQNIIKWGNANCIIAQNKSEDFAATQNYFDVILVDAPCSGEGLFRRDRDAIKEWSEKNVEMCSIRQREIISNAVRCLKPGGFLIYSTCTFEPEENDGQMGAAVGQWPLTNIQLAVENPTILRTKYGWQFYPHKIKGEGLYMAVLRKGETGNSPFKNQKSEIRNTKPFITSQYLRNPEKYNEIEKNAGYVFAIPSFMQNDFSFLEKHLYIRNAGIFLGNKKGNDFLPSIDLALSHEIKTDLPSVELNYDEAIAYLRCETPKIKTELRGWCLARYEGLNLGWMKMLENRWNNYFPKEWRILKK